MSRIVNPSGTSAQACARASVAAACTCRHDDIASGRLTPSYKVGPVGTQLGFTEPARPGRLVKAVELESPLTERGTSNHPHQPRLWVVDDEDHQDPPPADELPEAIDELLHAFPSLMGWVRSTSMSPQLQSLVVFGSPLATQAFSGRRSPLPPLGPSPTVRQSRPWDGRQRALALRPNNRWGVRT